MDTQGVASAGPDLIGQFFGLFPAATGDYHFGTP